MPYIQGTCFLSEPPQNWTIPWPLGQTLSNNGPTFRVTRVKNWLFNTIRGLACLTQPVSLWHIHYSSTWEVQPLESLLITHPHGQVMDQRPYISHPLGQNKVPKPLLTANDAPYFPGVGGFIWQVHYKLRSSESKNICNGKIHKYRGNRKWKAKIKSDRPGNKHKVALSKDNQPQIHNKW